MKHKLHFCGKKIAALLVCVLISLCLAGCGRKSTQTRYFAIADGAYSDVARFLIDNYETIVAQQGGGSYTIDGPDYILVDFTDYRSSATYISESYTNTMAEFAFAWLKPDSAVFWVDSTKTVGVMYALKPKEALREWDKVIKDMDSEEINEHLYTIGRWDKE